MAWLDNQGLNYFYQKLKQKFAPNRLVSQQVDGQMSSGDKVKLDDMVSFHGVCETSDTTPIKNVTCPNFKLEKGAWVAIRFNNANPSPAAEYRINVNSTGARYVYYHGGQLEFDDALCNGRSYVFVFDGSVYQMMGELDTWQRNERDKDGYVSATDGAAAKVWKTDEAGNPAWRDDDSIIAVAKAEQAAADAAKAVKDAADAKESAEAAEDATTAAEAASQTAQQAATAATAASQQAQTAAANAEAKAGLAEQAAADAEAALSTATQNAQDALDASAEAVRTANAASSKADTTAGQVNTLSSDLAAAKTNLETLTSDLSAEVSAREGLSSAHQTLSTQVSQNAATIESHASSITTLQTDVSAAQSDATKALGDAAAAAKAAKDADDAAKTAQSAAGAAASAAKDAQDDLDIAKQNLEDAKTALTTLEGRTDATEADISQAKKDIANAEKAVDTAQKAADNAKKAADDAQKDADDAQAAADAAQKTADDAAEAAKDAQDAIDAVSPRVTALETWQVQTDEKWASYATKTEVSAASSAAADAMAYAQGIKVGGRNLLLDTASSKTTPSSSGSPNEAIYTSYWYASEFGQDIIENALDDTTEVTLSFDYVVEGNSKTGANVYGQINNSIGNFRDVKSGDSGHYSQSHPLTTAQINYAANNTSRVRVRLRDASDGATTTVSNLKLEIGNTETTWTPAPEDIEAKILLNSTAIEQSNQQIALKANTTDMEARFGNVYTKAQADAAITVESTAIRNHVSSTYSTKDELSNAIDGVSGELEDYKEANDIAIATLQSQVDGQIEAWYYDTDPTSSSMPASSWTSDAEKERHVGDLYYNVSNGHSWRWMKEGSTYIWKQIPDSDAAAALAAAHDAQATADNKRRIFTATPFVPYDIGDLWVDGNTVKYATQLRTAEGTYTASDWSVTSTDDTLAQAAKDIADAADARSKAIYGESVSGAAAAVKVVNCDGFVLFKGATITVKCTTANTSAGALKMNVNKTGEIPVYFGNAATSATNQLLWAIGASMIFTYDGTGWVLQGQPSTWQGTGSVATGTAAKTTAISGAVICKGTTVTMNSTTATSVKDATLNVSGTGAKAIKAHGSNLAADSPYNWTANSAVQFTFDGQYWQLGNVAALELVNNLKTELHSEYMTNATWDVEKEALKGEVASSYQLKGDYATNDVVNKIHPFVIGTQPTTAATGTWTGDCPELSELKDGQQITYWLPVTGSGNATLTLTLKDGSSTGAIPCYYSGTSRLTTHYGAGNAINLTYRENVHLVTNIANQTYTDIAKGWWADPNYTDGDTINRTQYNSAIKAATAITANSLIVGTDAGYKNSGANVEFDMSYPILYSRAKIKASATGANNDIMASGINYSNNGSIQSGAANKLVYLKGTITNRTFKIGSSNYLTTVVPTAEDGFYYIPLGVMSSATNGSFMSTSTVYAFMDGSFQPVDTGTRKELTAFKSEVVETYMSKSSFTVEKNAITASVNEVSSAVATANQNITTLGNDISALDTKVDNIKVGGTNRILNSAGLNGTVFGKNTEYLAIDLGQSFMDIETGTEVTISFDLELIFGTATVNMRIYNTNNKGPKQFSEAVLTFNGTIGDTLRERVSVTGKINDRSNSNTPHNYLEFYTVYNTANYFSISNLKLEVGNVATAWSPAPEDVASDIAEAQSTADTAKSTADTAKTTADTAKSTADTAKTTADTAKSTADTAKTQSDTAIQDSATAKSDAATAKTNASNALTKAGNAETSASNAVTKANAAIKSTVQLWFSKANSTAPNKPTAHVTSTATTGNAWRTVVPTYNSSYPYYFYCYEYLHGDDTYTWSDVVYDQATTESQLVGRQGVNDAKAAKDVADAAKDKIDNLKVGGRNYAINSNFRRTFTISKSLVSDPSNPSYGIYSRGGVYDATVVDTTEKHNGFNTLKVVGSTAGSTSSKDVCVQPYGPWSTTNGANKTHLLSFWAKALEETVFYARMGYEGWSSTKGKMITIGTEWAHYQMSLSGFDTNDIPKPAAANSENAWVFYFDKATTVWLSEIMYEIDVNTWSAWSPAPEDTAYDISTAQSTADSTNAQLIASRSWYAECPTAAATAAKVATITPATTDFTLSPGKMVLAKFAETNSGAITSITLNVNGTGAKNIKYIYNGSLSNIPSAGYLKAGQMYTFTYDGTYWVVELNYNTDTYNRVLYSQNVKANSKTYTGTRIIVGTADGYENMAADVEFDLAYPILFYATGSSTTIASGSTANNHYLSINGVVFSNNGTIQSGTAYKTLYLKGTISANGRFKIAASPFMTTVTPTTEDGYYYIPLGVMSSATAGRFVSSDRLYAYINGAFQAVDTAAKGLADTAQETADISLRGIVNHNLLPGSNVIGAAGQDNVTGWVPYNNETSTPIYDGETIKFTRAASDKKLPSIGSKNLIPITWGDYYMYSAELMFDQDITVTGGTSPVPLNRTFKTSNITNYTGAISESNDLVPTYLIWYPSPGTVVTKNQWQKYYVIFKTPDTPPDSAKPYLYFRPFVWSNDNFLSSAAKTTGYIRRAKVERIYTDAVTPTDWEANQLDLIMEAKQGLAMKVNYSAFSTSNDGEAYLHGYSDYYCTTPADVNGWVMWNGHRRDVPKGMVNPDTKVPYDTICLLVMRLTDANATTGTVYPVWYKNPTDNAAGVWQYLNKGVNAATSGNAVATWTWTEATDVVLGQFMSPSSEGALYQAMLYFPAKHASEVQIKQTFASQAQIKELSDSIQIVAGSVSETSNALSQYYTKTETDAALKVNTDQISSAVSRVKTLEDWKGNLKIGGENLLRFTEKPNVTNAAGSVITGQVNVYTDAVADNSNHAWGRYASNGTLTRNSDDDGVRFTYTATSPNGITIPFCEINAILPEEEFMLSFDYKTDATKTGTLYLLHRSGGNTAITSSNLSASSAWVHYEKTFTWPANNNTADVLCFLMAYLSTSSPATYFEIRDATLKLERGNVATAWTPSHADVSQEITTTKSLITQTDTAIRTLITENYAKTSDVNTAIAKANARVVYATCTTAAATAAKEATITPATTSFTLTTGNTVFVRFSATNSAAVANLTLNVNGTGAKNIKYRNANLPAANDLYANQTLQFVYDGTYWQLMGELDTNSDTYDRTLHNNYILPLEAVTAGKLICGTSAGYKAIAANVEFDLSYPILWASAALTANTQVANTYEMYPSVNPATTGTVQGIAKNAQVYLKGTVTGKTFKVAETNFLTCTVPTSDDSMYYIPLGIVANNATTKMYFKTSNALYAYYEGAFREVSSGMRYALDNYKTTVDKNFVKSSGTLTTADQITSYVTKRYETDKVLDSLYPQKTIPDTRDANQTPEWYIANYPRQVVTEFKKASTLGLSGETYCYLQTVVQWSSSSGGWPKQTVQVAGEFYWRRGANATTWSSWFHGADQSYVTTYVSQQGYLTVNSDAITGLVSRTETLETYRGMQKIDTASRAFTTALWKTYGAVGHSENWTTGTSYDNSRIRVGDTAYLIGTVTDGAKGSATIIGTVTAVNGTNGTSSITMTSQQLIFGGDALDTVRTSADSANSKIDNLKIGTSNLFKISDMEPGCVSNKGVMTNISAEYEGRARITGIVPEAEYYLSITDTNSASNTGWTRVNWHTEDGTFISEGKASYFTDSYQIKLTAPSNAKIAWVSSRHMYGPAGPTTKVMFEKGNIPSEWSLAPEDSSLTTGGFDIMWNRAYFASDTDSGGECYICKKDPQTGKLLDENGWVMWNGNKHIIAKDVININAVVPYNIPAYVVARIANAYTSTASVSSATTNYVVWYASGWKYTTAAGAAAAAWTWNDTTDMVLGRFVETGSEKPFTETETWYVPRHYYQLSTEYGTAYNALSTANTANNRAVAHYATSSTAAATAAKAASCSSFALFTGAQVVVYFTNKNTATSPTLNVNSTGAKPIWAYGKVITSDYYWDDASYVSFIYDGTHWCLADNSSFSKIKSTADDITSTVASTYTKIDTMNKLIGGENMAYNSSDGDSWASSSSSYGMTSYAIGIVELSENFVKGEKYTVTIWGDAPTRSDKTSTWYGVYWGGGSVALGNVTITDGKGSLTFTAPNSSNAHTDNAWIKLYNTPTMGASGTTYQSKIDAIMVTKGTVVPLYWAPNPRDNNNAITTLISSTTSQLEQTKDSFTASINEVNQYITDLENGEVAALNDSKKSLENQMAQVKTWLKFDNTDFLTIGKSNSDFSTQVTNTQILFKYKGDSLLTLDGTSSTVYANQIDFGKYRAYGTEGDFQIMYNG